MFKFLLLIAAAIVIHHYRGKFLYAWQPRVNDEPFEGDLYQVGECYVAKRANASKPTQTLVCIHGFLEDMRYFTEVYQDPSIELIMINSCGYHSPFSLNNLLKPDWAVSVPYPEGSIEYDANVLAQAVENLATTKKIRLHGHSRGGAVVLEAIKQRPDLLGKLEVVLEAPILPKGKPYPALALVFNKVGLYLLPITFTLFKKIPFDIYSGVYKPLTPRKRELLAGLMHNPKTFTTILENAHNMNEWWDHAELSLYDKVAKGTILIGAEDKVLDVRSMTASAEASHKNINVVITEGTTHFISLEAPRYARELAENTVKTSSKKIKKVTGEADAP